MSLHRLLGTELPIIQAPMAGVQGSALALAVSNAGGLGSLPCATLDPESLEKELSILQAGTSKPFNVNFFSHPTPQPNAQRDAAWRSKLSPYYREFNVEMPGDFTAAPPISAIGPGHLEVLARFRPAVVSFHFGLPETGILAEVKKLGATIIVTATTVEEACLLEAQGVDAIIAQGVEAGGHRGNFLPWDPDSQLGTFALLPQVVNAVKVPVIAAGGVCNAQGVVAALALGATAVQVGTAYLLCPEATLNAQYRATLKSAAASHTAITNVFTGRPARAIMNRLIRELGPMCPQTPEFPLALSAVSTLRAGIEGDASREFAAFWCGQNASSCHEIPAAALTRELAGVLTS